MENKTEVNSSTLVSEDTFIQCVADGDFARAALELESKANSFSFFRTASEIVDILMSSCSHQAWLFSNAWVAGLITMRDQVDGRNQAAIDTAIKLGDLGYVTYPVDFERMVQCMRKQHRTVLQQASILPFMVIDRVDGKPRFAEFDDWYKMPLI